MIEINLVPPQLKKKKKARSAAHEPAAGLSKHAVIGYASLLIVLLALGAGALQFMISMKLAERKRLMSELAELVPQKINTERYTGQIKELNGKLAPLEKILGNRDFMWSQKLNEISDNLPRGVWLTKMQLEQGVLLINGSAVSKTQTEMIGVHSFNTSLKDNDAFMKDFSEIELEYIKSRTINGTPVADFTIRVDL
ncbi:MAG TPA: PilN domain-containing protein [Candidatus Omnitrophota bacterium]|nr:PilN domain-containing protein [Candidatus Omnitrophota bacterium]